MKLKYIWYRLRQAGFSAFMYLAPIRKAQVISGTGSLLQIPEKIKKDGKKKVLVVTTPGFMKRGSLVPFFEELKKQHLEYAIFSEVQPDPTTDCIEEAVALYKKEKCEVIVAIGGGSVIDCSKALGARIARPKKSLQQMQGLLKVLKRIPDIYAVPTTAGTGSEATAGAVITDGKNHYKFTILDLCLVPRYAVLDAGLTCPLPPHITAHTGMDALTHAVEAYTNCFCSPLAKKMSLDAVKLIYENLETAYLDGNNKKARENMLLASYYAGVAINNNFIGYVHAIAHGIGGLYGVTHGKANAIILPYVLEAFGEKSYKKLADLADLVGLAGNTQEEKAKAFIDSILDLNKKLGIEKNIVELRKEDIPELAKRAVKEGNPTYPVPMIWENAMFEKVIEKIV
ncbi:MAG: iron-containing alcohol dehydrogenase [Lachnospiraceae bacterium]|nr:iron-containing alcohol dehydrogenase [Lachnospiraceae bacterium]